MKWHPIKTAPRDNTRILLFVPDSEIMEILIGRRGPDNDDWMMDFGNHASPIDIPVTHWMHLPDNPDEN
jgi:hypothetical protein